ncbi:hypothetical protein TNCV_3025711 [Trichonephila clavipes]|nr:hypothetical protein TNCV_3025711 [Trichonephila clavipes]
MQVTVRFCSVPPQETLGVVRGLPPTTREDLRLNGYLDYPMPQRHYTFTNIPVFSGIRTQSLRHRSQRRYHSTGWAT